MRLIDGDALQKEFEDLAAIQWNKDTCTTCARAFKESAERVEDAKTVDAVPVPDGGIGELSDGYHTFNGLYYQRMMLFATLVKTYKERAWKSHRHSDGELCFGGGWFIVGIDTPQGGYTYHYEDKYFDLFDCVELLNGKEWDGHTEDDVTRLLTLDAVERKRGEWVDDGLDAIGAMGIEYRWKKCPNCGERISKAPMQRLPNFCPNCGADMRGEEE